MKSRLVFYLFSVICFLIISTGVSFAASKIFYTDITSGPNTGGENNNGAYLSIFGKDFETNINNVKVYVGNGEVARYIYLGPSLGRPDVQQLSVQLGPNTSTGTIRVVVNGIESNTDHTFTVRSGNFYYVSTSGNDSTGQANNITRPYRTANYVMGLSGFGAGDFMVIRGGNYDLSTGDENLYNSRWLNVGPGSGSSVKSGTSESNSITIYGYPGENVIIDWGNISTGGTYGIRAVGATSYYTFANIIFDLKDSGGAAVFLGFYSDTGAYCNNCRIVNLKVKGGMGAASGGVNTFYLHRAENFKLYGLDIGNQSPLADTNLESHIIYVSHFYTNGDIGWIYVHDNKYGRAALQIAGDGWGVTPYSVANGTWGQNTNVRVHDSLFMNLPLEAILCNLGSFEVFIYDNVIVNANTKKVGGFSPIALRGAGLNQGNYYLYNNTIYTDAEAGYPGGIIQMGYSPGSTYPEHVTLYNNIIYAMSSTTNYYQINHTNFTTDKITSNNNVWYNSNQAVPSWAGANRVTSDPLFVNPNAGDFHLNNTASPAKDTGSSAVAAVVTTDYDGNPRPMDAGYDIGAYEYIGSAVPILQFSAATYSVSEGAGTATISVTRTGSSSGAVSVNYATSNGTATAGSDYTAKSGTLNWIDGDVAAKTFTIAINDDSIDENDETINLTLSIPGGGAVLGSQSTATLTITDNDSTGSGGGGDTSPPSSSSGGDSGGGSGGGCGFVKDDNNGKVPRANGGAAAFAMMLILTLAGIAIARRFSKRFSYNL